MKTLLLSSRDIANVVRAVGIDNLMDHVIEGIAGACRDYDDARFEVPVRDGFSYSGESTGLVEWMPLLHTDEQVALKLVAYHPNNPKRFGLPTVLSTAICFDTESGHADCIADATFVTSIRTGAASAIASRVLASPTSRTLGLIGAGAQAVTQLHALSRVFKLDTVLFTDTDDSTCLSFADRVRVLGLSVTIEKRTVDDIVREADIICTATSVDVGAGPVVPDGDYKPDVHINAVGSDFPGKTELPLTLLRRSLVCPDFRAQAILEGECQQLDESFIGPDLSSLVKRESDYSGQRDRITVFDSTGWALEDYVTVKILKSLALEHGCGQRIQFETVSSDPKDPFGFLDAEPPLSIVSRRQSA
ncbi:MAG: ornithine cyclodeaminase family protein [Gammaproteobacteria bacterium]